MAIAESPSYIEQLTEYCECQNVNEKDVYELINLISSYTGWMQNLCETFLSSDRTEVRELPDCVGDCDVYIFEPYYRPFDSHSFTFQLVEQNGLEETVTPIESYIYSAVDDNFRIKLDLPNCSCRPECGCESKYKLLVQYTAGYEEIPDCLLAVFCDALQWIEEKNKCDCEQCAECDTQYGNTNQIDYTKLEGRLQDHFLEVLTKQYFRSLSLISLVKKTGHLWGIVV